MKVSHFTRNIYQTETVTSGLCYTEDLIYLENNIVWFWSSPDVQSTDGSMELTTFCISFWKRVYNLKKIVNIQSLFVLTVGYVDMTTHPLTKYFYIIERAYSIYRLFILFTSTLPFLMFLYAVSRRYKWAYLHASIYILFYIMFYVINTMEKH